MPHLLESEPLWHVAISLSGAFIGDSTGCRRALRVNSGMDKSQGIDSLRKQHRGGSARIPEEADLASSWWDQAGCKEETAFSLALDQMFRAVGEEAVEEGAMKPSGGARTSVRVVWGARAWAVWGQE